MTTTPPILSLLLTLPLLHPSYITLIDTHYPLKFPSNTNQQTLSKFLARITTALISKSPIHDVERRSALSIGTQLIKQDQEGYVLLNHGKAWISSCVLLLSSSSGSGVVPLEEMKEVLHLMEVVVIGSRGYPGFEREVVQPVMGKLGVGLGRLVDKYIAERDWDMVVSAVTTCKWITVSAPLSCLPNGPFIVNTFSQPWDAHWKSRLTCENIHRSLHSQHS